MINRCVITSHHLIQMSDISKYQHTINLDLDKDSSLRNIGRIIVYFFKARATVDHGLWTEDCGLLTVDCKLLTVDLGRRNVDCGPWTVDCGSWNVD